MPVQAERLSVGNQQTASGAGTATFTFQAPPTGLVFLGTLYCGTAPVAATFSASVAGTPWSSWLGQSVGGPVQARAGEVVTVLATGLTAATVYTLQWTGSAVREEYANFAYPDTNAAPPAVVAAGTGPLIVEFTVGVPTIAQAKVAVGGTAVQLSSSSIPLTQGIVVEAMKANTDQVYVGLSTVNTTHDGTGNGWELQPGFVSPVLPFVNANLVYINSATAGSAVSWAAF